MCEVDAAGAVVVVDAEEDAKGAGPAEQRGRRAAEGDAATATSAWSARIECAVLHFMESMDESIRAVYGEFTPTIAFACWKSEYVMCCVRPSLHFVHVRENPGAHGARYLSAGGRTRCGAHVRGEPELATAKAERTAALGWAQRVSVLGRALNR